MHCVNVVILGFSSQKFSIKNPQCKSVGQALIKGSEGPWATIWLGARTRNLFCVFLREIKIEVLFFTGE
jgi:hypothetical protein